MLTTPTFSVMQNIHVICSAGLYIRNILCTVPRNYENEKLHERSILFCALHFSFIGNKLKMNMNDLIGLW